MPTGTGKSTTAKQRREWLKNSIRAHLLPLLIKQGFKVAAPLLLSPPVDRAYVLSFPSWGRLMRTRESGVDLIEIQFATYQRAAFRLNAGVVPTDGLQIASRGPLPSEGIAVHWLDEWFETHARPWLRPMLKAMGLEPLGAWFSVWYWPYQSPRPEDYEKLVLRAASVMPELELALREGRLGRHVRRVVLPSRDRPRLRTVNTTSLA